MTYQETLTFLYQQLPMFQRIGQAAFKKDLTNIKKICSFLNNPQQKFKSIHIGGTNGKGSSSHYVAAILQQAGYKAGLYTSPHLKNFTERIKINGNEIDEAFIINFVKQIRPLLKDIQPSFFEITVALAFQYFAEEKVDIAVIEVGMGGAFDSTNIIIPLLSLITNVSLDHTHILGSSIAEIAHTKAGIIKPSTPIIISEYQKDTASIFIEKAKTLNSPIYFASELFQIKVHKNEAFNLLFDIYKDGRKYFPDINIGSRPNYTLKNLPGVLQAVYLLNTMGFHIQEDDIIKGIVNMPTLTGLKGRWQILSREKLTICDVAHNEAGIKLILDEIKRIPFEKLFVILGFVKDKSIDKILKLLPKEAIYFFCEASIPRALPAQELHQIANHHGLKGEVVKDVNQAIKMAQTLNEHNNDLVLVTGSTFIIAEIENL